MGCVVFHFILISCKSGDIGSIIIVRRIKYVFMRLTSQILNTALDTLETRDSRCYSLGFQTEGCVTNVNSTHKSNAMYPAKSMYKFSMILNFCLMKGVFY